MANSESNNSREDSNKSSFQNSGVIKLGFSGCIRRKCSSLQSLLRGYVTHALLFRAPFQLHRLSQDCYDFRVQWKMIQLFGQAYTKIMSKFRWILWFPLIHSMIFGAQILILSVTKRTSWCTSQIVDPYSQNIIWWLHIMQMGIISPITV